MKYDFRFVNFNKIKVYIDVPFDRKDEAKKYKTRWDPDCKSWYFEYEIDDDEYDYDDNLKIITIFKVTNIIHPVYDDQNGKHFLEVVKFFNRSKKATRNKFINCQCGCSYKYKREDKHLKSDEHIKYLKEQEEFDEEYINF